MKNMKKIFLLLVAITTTSQAQMAKKVIQTFPAHIINKIYEVASTIELTEDQQMKLGASLSKNDRLANESIRKGDPVSYLEKYYAVDKTLLAPIVSADQLDQLLYQRNKQNRFLIALKETSVLKLSPTQIKAIRDQNSVFKQDEPMDKQIKVFTKKLDSILTKPQYEKLIEILNIEKSEKQAKEDYNNLLSSKLVTQKDSAGVYTKIYDYHLKRNSNYDMLPETMSDDEKKGKWERLVTEHEPSILTRYKIATNGFYIKNLFTQAILYENELKLSEIQTDSLLAYQRKLSLATIDYYSKNVMSPSIKVNKQENSALKKENLEKQMKAYKNKINEILTKPQYEKLIEILNIEKSEKQAKEDYINLLSSKRVTQKDSVGVYTKIYDYYLKRNSTYDMLPETISADEKNSIWEKLVIEHEPNILTRYKIATNGYYMKNLFTEAILYENELNLSEIQIESLLVYHRKLILITIDYYSKNKVSDSNFFADFENTNISKILNQKQITTLLGKKNETKAVQLAHKNWDDLEKLGVSKDLEKAILNEFTNYHLKSLIASDWLKIDTNMMNVFYKRDIEMQKPELLRQLEAKEQNQKNVKRTKNELRW